MLPLTILQLSSKIMVLVVSTIVSGLITVTGTLAIIFILVVKFITDVDDKQVQPDQINMAVLFWYTAYTSVHWTVDKSLVHRTINTRPCLIGHLVQNIFSGTDKRIG